MKTLDQMRAERLGRMTEEERSEYEAGYEEIDAGIRIAQLFYDERTALGFTQAELAKRMHTTQASIARIENGAVMPGTAMLERLARVAHKRVALV